MITAPKLQYALSAKAIEAWNPAIHAESDDTTITILDEIGDSFWNEGVTAKRISAALRAIGNKDITVKINSPGGSFFEGAAIYNLLKQHKGHVTVKVLGLAASSASLIAMAGDEILMPKNLGWNMVHNCWSVAVGNRHDMTAAANEMAGFDIEMAKLYAEVSGKSVEEISAVMDAETWFSSDKAIEAGLATGYYDEEPEIDESIDTKAMLTERIIENALRIQNPNSTRSERRALLATLKGVKQTADATVTPSADDIQTLINTMKA